MAFSLMKKNMEKRLGGLLRSSNVRRGAVKARADPDSLGVAFFTDTYLPNVDGVVTSLLNTRAYLEAHGHAVYVFSAGSQSDARQNLDPHVTFFRSLTFPPYPQYKLALFPYWTATQAVKRHPVDLIHSHAITSMGLAARHVASQLHKPLVGTFHTMVTDGAQYLTKNEWLKKQSSRVLWRAIALYYRGFDVVTAPSEATADLLKQNGVPDVRVMPNGVDLQRFRPDLDRQLVRQLLGIAPDEQMILVAGRLGYEKNVDVVIKSAKSVLKTHKVRFVITGDGPARPFYEQLAAAQGVRKVFEFEGFVNRKALPYYYAAADGVVSASAFETQGLSLLEAMACGTPCVGADALAIPETIDDGKNGFLFKSFDSHDCAEKIGDLLNQGTREKSAFRKAARCKAEGYSLEKTGQKTLELYEELV
ncbi:glycosyltransferase [Candidatus Micrarchaeota archaeon]|nr:glycosyltransferase [Candidatus Micrarchaeota archaeon]